MADELLFFNGSQTNYFMKQNHTVLDLEAKTNFKNTDFPDSHNQFSVLHHQYYQPTFEINL